MLCLNSLTRGGATPLNPCSFRRGHKSTFRYDWGKFSIVSPGQYILKSRQYQKLLEQSPVYVFRATYRLAAHYSDLSDLFTNENNMKPWVTFL